MCKYQLLFKPLWRMKHFEFVLSSKIWKEQMSNAKVIYFKLICNIKKLEKYIKLN